MLVQGLSARQFINSSEIQSVAFCHVIVPSRERADTVSGDVNHNSPVRGYMSCNYITATQEMPARSLPGTWFISLSVSQHIAAET